MFHWFASSLCLSRCCPGTASSAYIRSDVLPKFIRSFLHSVASNKLLRQRNCLQAVATEIFRRISANSLCLKEFCPGFGGACWVWGVCPKCGGEDFHHVRPLSSVVRRVSDLWVESSHILEMTWVALKDCVYVGLYEWELGGSNLPQVCYSSHTPCWVISLSLRRHTKTYTSIHTHSGVGVLVLKGFGS